MTVLDNMKRAAEYGAVILPAMPGFYHGVKTISDLIDFVRGADPRSARHSQFADPPLGRIGVRFVHLRHILEMIRFSHTLFALPFALLAAAMAWALNVRSTPPVPFRWLDLVGILVCMSWLAVRRWPSIG